MRREQPPSCPIRSGRHLPGFHAGPLDTAVNTPLPVITPAFGLLMREILWVVIPSVLAEASLTLIFERPGDLLGYRRIFSVDLLVVQTSDVANRVRGFGLVGRIADAAPALRHRAHLADDVLQEQQGPIVNQHVVEAALLVLLVADLASLVKVSPSTIH